MLKVGARVFTTNHIKDNEGKKLTLWKGIIAKVDKSRLDERLYLVRFSNNDYEFSDGHNMCVKPTIPGETSARVIMTLIPCSPTPQ